mgnify:CR=1 FL=1
MATYEKIYDEWETESLKKQIVVSVMIASRAVVLEPDTTPNHAARLGWAKQALLDPFMMAQKMSVAVITDTKIQSGKFTDADVQAIINASIDIFAALA